MKGVLNTLVSEANPYIPITIAMTAAYHRRTYKYRRQAESTDVNRELRCFCFFLPGWGSPSPFVLRLVIRIFCPLCCFFLSDVLFTDGIKRKPERAFKQ